MSRHIASGAPAIAALACSLLAVATSDPARSQNFPQNKPDFCKKIWSEVGIPKAGSGVKITTVCHLGYITGHNDANKGPSWVIERLTTAETGGDKGTATRENLTFSADDKLPPAAQAQPADYDGNGFGFDQGHNAPAADFAGNQDDLDDTFVLSNAVPQVGAGFNRSIWRALETQVRNLVGSNHPVMYVITGSVDQDSKPIKIANDVCKTEMELPVVQPTSICKENHHKKDVRCEAGVAVPAAMFKIVYDPAAQNAFAVLMENENHTGRYKSGRGADYIRAHKVGISTIEDLTGLTFFPDFPARKKNQLRSNCVDVKMH